MNTRGINKGHLTHTDNLNLGTTAGTEVEHQVVEFVGDAKEVGSVDFVNSTTFGNEQMLLVNIHVSFITGVNLVLDDRYFGGLHNTLNKECASNDKANLDGNG